MDIEMMHDMPATGGCRQRPWRAVVRLDSGDTASRLADAVGRHSLRSLVFDSEAYFADEERVAALCREMRELDVNVLWSARLAVLPGRETLRAMRLAGCQRLELRPGPEQGTAADITTRAREFGFDLCLRQSEGDGGDSSQQGYSVAEREAVAELLPGLHAAQFDLAVAYYRARRFGDVMRPLGKAMVLRFPMNELCLNLLACLSAARHYPDMAAGLLDQAGHGCPHPVVFRNRGLLRSWMESGGDLRGVRLELDPVGTI
jgi:hypothetical protein